MKKIIIFILSIFVLTAVNINNARGAEALQVINANEDTWVEIQSVVLPFELPVNKTATAKGFKFWFTFNGIGDVSISATNYKKYSTKSEYMELVKWRKGNKYRYTIRAKAKVDVDLAKLFEK